jgi:hypothetical protein
MAAEPGEMDGGVGNGDGSGDGNVDNVVPMAPSVGWPPLSMAPFVDLNRSGRWLAAADRACAANAGFDSHNEDDAVESPRLDDVIA